MKMYRLEDLSRKPISKPVQWHRVHDLQKEFERLTSSIHGMFLCEFTVDGNYIHPCFFFNQMDTKILQHYDGYSWKRK